MQNMVAGFGSNFPAIELPPPRFDDLASQVAKRNFAAIDQLKPPIGWIPENVSNVSIFDHPQTQRPLRPARHPLLMPRRIGPRK